MKFIYLYNFRGNEATFQVQADSKAEADERFEAMKLADFEGTLVEEIAVPDYEMLWYAERVVH